MSARIWLWGLLILACVGAVGIIAQHRQLAGLKDQRGQILAQLAGAARRPVGFDRRADEEPGKSAAGDSGPAAASSELLQLRNQLGQLTENASAELTGVRAENSGSGRICRPATNLPAKNRCLRITFAKAPPSGSA